MNCIIKNKNFYSRCLGSFLLLLFSVLGINGQTVNLSGNQSINGFKRFNSGLFFGIDSSAQLPLGTDKPYTRFGIVYDPATNSELPSSFTPTTYAFNDQGLTTIVAYDGAGGEPRFTLNKARGTLTNPLSVQTGDVLGRIMFRPFQGSEYLPSISLMSFMTGSTDNMYTNANLTFNIRKNGNNNPHFLDNFLELHPNGNIYLPQVPPNLSSTGEVLLRNSQSGAIEKSSYSNFVQNILGLGSAAYSDKTKFWAKSPWENNYYIEHGWDGTGWNLYAANNASDEQANIHKVNINGNAASANFWGGRTANFDAVSPNANFKLIGLDYGDNVVKQVNPESIKDYLGLGNFNNWSSIGSNSTIVGGLTWRNYGNNHIIFDASSGFSPLNTSINNSDSEVAWQASFPTLMGFNGVNTFGVRVDRARLADLWGGRPADLNSEQSAFSYILTRGEGATVRLTNLTDFKNALGLSSGGETLQSVTDRGGYTTQTIFGTESIGFPTLSDSKSGGIGVRAANSLYGLKIGVEGVSGIGWIQAQRYDSSLAYGLALNPAGGNVGIGTTNPTSLLDVRGRITVPEIAFALNGSDDSDPYRLRKVQSSPNVNWLELQLNDDYNESFRIYGNSCEGLGCIEYSNNLYHSFDASGNVFHKGNVGIGLMNSSDRLTVNGAVKFTATSNPELAYTKISWNTVGDGKSVFDNHKDLGNGGFTFRTTNNNTSYSELLNINMSGIQVYGGQAGSTIKGGDLGVGSAIVNFIKSDNISALYLRGDGNIGIGTTNPGTDRLAVNGNIKAKAVKVDPNAWPDYVFETNYPLLSLKDTEAFIQKNKHLPEVPSASEVAARGHDLGEMNTILLKKVEELTLHLIDLKKNYEELKSELDKLKPVHDEKNKQP